MKSHDRGSAFGFGGNRKPGKELYRKRAQRQMFLEPLEPRQMMTVQPGDVLGGFTGNYYPPQHAKASSTSFLSAPVSGDALTVALNYFGQNQATYGLSAADLSHYALTNRYSDSGSGITHLYLQQSYNGLPVMDAVAAANVMPGGQILTASASFVGGLTYPGALTPLAVTVPSQNAVGNLASAVGLSFDGTLGLLSPPSGRSQKTVYSDAGISQDPITVQLTYVPAPGGGVDLAWEILAHTPDGQHYYDAAVGASGSRAGQVIRVADWIADATYNVFPQNPQPAVQDPLFGNRVVVVDPQDPVTSPFGWHDNNGFVGPEFFDTRGNNVVAQEDINGDDLAGTRPASPTLDFTDPFDPLQGTAFNQNAGIDNAFYWANLAHDITARHGFNEAAGNFQTTNYSGQGVGFDPVRLDTRDPLGGITTGFGPNMLTLPEGASPELTMGDNTIDIFTGFPLPVARDSSFDATILTHEFFHGVSNRLTGGPANVSALQALQSGGMGEGWSDWFALVMTSKTTDNQNTARTSGNWYLGQTITGSGIREYPYSFDMSIDPHTFNDFNLPGGQNLPFPFSNGGNEVHNAGEIWASALWDMTWLLINKYGYDTSLTTGTGGQAHALDLVLQGLKLQPVNPSFTEARDAIISADFALNQGDNYELIWHAFARRGLGVSAFVGPTSNQTNIFPSFDEPPPLGHVFGTVFNDDNANARRDNAEVPLAGWTVYLDQNDNGKFESFETNTITDTAGSYHFNFTVDTNAIIREVVKPNWTQTLPSGGGARRVLVPRGQTITGQDFGNHGIPGKISGLIWNDIDQDLVRDTSPLEPGLEGLFVYVDYNNDSKLNLLEPSAVTDHNGRYTIQGIRPGTWTVRVLGQPGVTPFSPLSILVDSNATTPNVNFPNGTTPVITINKDFGDAPDTYGTTLAANGARHGLLPGFQLGATLTADPNGQPSVGATADSSDDGIVFGAGGPTAIITPGATADLTVTVNTTGFLPGKLQGWIDYNHDGDFFDSGEQVVTNLVLGTGVHHVFVPIPANLATGSTYARFRYGYEANLGPTGASTAGEVEDYQVTALANTPIAKDDDLTGILLKPGVTTALNVLANDSGTTFGAPKIFSVDTSTLPAGTTVTINAAQDTLFITPGPTAFGPYSFTYKVTDNSGRPPAQSVSSPGTVKINVTLSDPKVVDDFVPVTFTAQPQQVNIQALANDLLPAPNAAAFQIIQGSVQLITPNAPAGSAGAMLIAPGGKSLNFTAPAGFHGTLIYQYTINEVPDDPTTNPATGRVTVQVADVPAGGVPQPDLTQYVAQLNVDILDSSHQPLTANSLLHPGDFFYARVRSLDLRPIAAGAPRGVETAYLDLLFNRAVASPVLSPENPLGMNIVFDGRGTVEATTTVQANPTATSFAGNPADLDPSDGFYNNHTLTFTTGALAGQSGWILSYNATTGTFTFGSNTFNGAPAATDTFTVDNPLYSVSQSGAANVPGPGSIDESGAAHVDLSLALVGSGQATVFTVLMQVQPGAAGQNLQVFGDPADVDPNHRIELANDPGPGTLVLSDEQVFLRPSPAIPVVQLGGGEFSNSVNRLDVNDDGHVAPEDALMVINEINSTGQRTLSMADRGPQGFAPPTTFIDVDMDSVVTPTDALLVINYLNSLSPKASASLSGGEGEASDDPFETFALAADAGAEEAAADTAVQDVLDEPDQATTHVINTMSAGGQLQPVSTSLLSLTPFFASTYRSNSTNQSLFHGTAVNPDAADELFGGLADEEE